MADCFHINGILARFSQNFDQAKTYYNQAIEYYGRANSKVKIQTLLNLGDLFQKYDKIDSARYYYNLTDSFFSNHNYPLLEAFLHSNMAKIREAEGDSAEAKILKEYVVQLNESSQVGNQEQDLFPSFFHLGKNTRSKNRINRTVNEWKKERSQLLIKQLETENKLKQTRIQLQRYGLSLSVIIALLLTYLIISEIRKRKKINRQNQTIQTALKEKEFLLREIHHRVKNNLQIISSLLRLQSDKTMDFNTIEALKDGQARVHSMSLIHQDLYNKENLSGVNIRSYLEKLLKNLMETYQISEQKIEVYTNIDPLELDVDTVVPLGLIINELVTNALKYAFPDDKVGIINISLLEQNDKLKLTVKDNGIGFDKNLLENSNTFGFDMINVFVETMDANLNVYLEEGTHIEITLEDYRKI